MGPNEDAERLGPELIEAYSGSRIDAELIGSVLEGSGIECSLWGTGSSYLPETGAKLNAVRVMVRPSDLDRAREVIAAAGVGDLDLGEAAPADWDDDELDEPFAGPWYSRPWGQVVMAVVALLLVVAMIATYALE